MHAALQPHFAFHLAGMHPPSEFASLAELDLRPALFAGYRDLTQLRYDFPLVLVHGREDESAVQSLSGMFDGALREIAAGAEGKRLRQHALRIEREIRALAADRAQGCFAELWNAAAGRLSSRDDELLRDSLTRLRAALPIDGEVVDCDQTTASRLLRHAWKAVHDQKARRFRSDIDRLIAKLSDILRADLAHSKEGLSAQNLKAAVGTTYRASFDFDALSRVLRDVAPHASLSESRRRRIRGLLAVLQSQRFFAMANDDEGKSNIGAPYPFTFESCAGAIAAYRERLPRMIELTKAAAMAELEIAGEYKDSTHDAFFAEFGANGLDPHDADLFPDYLICVRAAEMDAAEADMILEAFSGGLRAKVLVQTDDLLEQSPIAGGTLASGLRSKQLASMAMGLNWLYVLQSSGSQLFQYRERLFRGLTYPGSALFSVFSGATGNGASLPPYLNAAAAMESRAFPAFVYDPSAGPDWASRFDLRDNPQVERDWPVHDIVYEDTAHQSMVESVTFTLVDFIACDKRHAHHFARVPNEKRNGSMLPIADFLAGEPTGRPETVPCLLMIDRDDVLQMVIVDDKLIRETRRCADAWRSLQELGGIHNSHAARLLEQEKKAWAEQMPPAAEPRTNGQAGPPVTPAVSVAAPAGPAVPAAAEPEPAEGSSDEAYIETARCTSCNECIQINDKMFAYDANKQASIVNPDAGTYRQLVEAAESCQVSIIHPGKPRNPSEPDLDELKKRAELYL
jgi:uncharacterized Fe-S cluster protein YjdI